MKTKILLLLLVLTMALSVLCACGGGNVEETTTGSVDTQSTTVATTEAPVPSSIDIVADGKSVYGIVRDEDADTSAAVVTSARNILNQIKKLTDVNAKLGTDWVKRGGELDSSTYEILVGITDYPETRQVMESLTYGQWGIRVVGNKIVVFGYSNAALSKAVNKFNNIMAKCISEDGKSISVDPAELNVTEDHDERLGALPLYEGGDFSSYYKPGDSVDEIIVANATPDTHKAYLKTLESAGYQCYTTNELNGNLFATYTNDKYTVTAGYYEYETAARILIEPLAPAVGLESDNKYTPVTTSQITMFGMEHTDGSGDTKGNGLSILIRLTDGRFVIVDGGFNRGQHANQLVKALKEQSKEYAKTNKDITIAAWIVTHPHGDHDGLLKDYYSNFMTFTVQNFLVNNLSEAELSRSLASDSHGKNFGSGDVTAHTRTEKAAKALKATLHQVHVGQVFYFADLRIDILYTMESFGPKVCNALNTTSTVMRMEFGGKDGTVYMSTGDATGYGMEIATQMFGDYMQSDIVQVAHHGYTTWGNDNGMMKAYRAINAATVMWPQGTKAFPTYKEKSYNKVVFEVPNYKELYVAGVEGDMITLPIPYTVGNAVVKRVNG